MPAPTAQSVAFVRVAAGALCGVGIGCPCRLTSLRAERVRRRSPCSRSGAWPVSELDCAVTEWSVRAGACRPPRAPKRVAEWSRGMDQRRSQAAPASQVPPRVLAGSSNTVCRLRRLAGLTALRKTVPAVGEALRAGGRHDVGGERGARVVETSRSCGEFGASRPSRAPKNVRWPINVRVPATSEGTETSNGRAWAARGAPIGTSLPRQKAPR